MWSISNIANCLGRKIVHNVILYNFKRNQPAVFWFSQVAANGKNLPPEIKYPLANSKLKNYLDKLKETQADQRTFNEAILRNIMKQYEYRLSIVDQYKELIQEIGDETETEIAALADEEKRRFTEILAEIDEEILNDVILLNGDEPNVSSMLIEISAGVGGREAMLFARELFEMYANYVKYKKWDYDILEDNSTGLGGIRNGTIVVRDRNAYEILQNEAGVHRVQRIPKTERGGRVHTSTAVVLIVPCENEIQIKINPNDLRIETKRSSGPGGQNVNKLESAVRIVHIPTGIAVECQEERTQVKNKQIAMRKLHNQLYQIEFSKQVSSQKSMRKSQTGTRTRNEKLRTYNYAQNRVTDHRLNSGAGTIHNLEGLLLGESYLDEFIFKVNKFIQRQRINEIVENS